MYCPPLIPPPFNNFFFNTLNMFPLHIMQKLTGLDLKIKKILQTKFS